MTKKQYDERTAKAAAGFRDLRGEDAEMRSRLVEGVTRVWRTYGFERLETPAIETAAGIGAFLPDTDRPNDGVYTWTPSPDEDRLALRYDLTAPLARFVVQRRDELIMPWRRWSAGPVWRNESPDPGRYREFWQCDADIVGAPSIGADAEVITMMAEALVAAGALALSPEIWVGNRKFLDALLDAIGLEGETERLQVCRTIDKMDRLGEAAVTDLLTGGRLDASGAFTPGIGLGKAEVGRILAYLGATSPAEALRVIGPTPKSEDGARETEMILSLIGTSSPVPVRFDPAIVRGLGYYTGPVFEAVLKEEIRDETGRPRRIGSVGGGGRYDGLIRRFTGQDVPSVGVSVGIDRLATALMMSGRAGTDVTRPVLVTVIDGQIGRSQAMARELRKAGVRAEVYYGASGRLPNQLKYANRLGAAYAIIEGERERQAGSVMIKDLDYGAEIGDGMARADWLSGQQQREVRREDLVAEVLSSICAGRDILRLRSS